MPRIPRLALALLLAHGAALTAHGAPSAPSTARPAPSEVRFLVLCAPRPTTYERLPDGGIQQADTPASEVPPTQLFRGSGKEAKPLNLPINRISPPAPPASAKPGDSAFAFGIRKSVVGEKGKVTHSFSPVASVDPTVGSKGALVCLFRKSEKEPIATPASLVLPIDEQSLPPGSILVVNTAAAPVMGLVGGTQVALAPGKHKVVSSPKLVDGAVELKLVLGTGSEYTPLANSARYLPAGHRAVLATYVADSRLRPTGADWLFDTWTEEAPPTPEPPPAPAKK